MTLDSGRLSITGRGVFRDLRERYTILYISKNKNRETFRDYFIDFSDADAYSIRNIASILYHCKAYLGIDTGLTQLSIANGCKTYVFHDNIGSAKFNNYAYTFDMWRGRECRAAYYSPQDSKNLIDNLLGPT